MMTIMTTKTRREREAANKGGAWPVAEAKARLSALIDRALTDGPQTITRKGHEAVVVVSAVEWKRKTKRQGNLSEFFATSPLRNAEIKISRRKDKPRDINF